MKIFTNNAIEHPFRALTRFFRRVLTNRDMGDPMWDGGEVPAALKSFTTGESLPWKGVMFKVGKVVGGDFPCVILVPADRTRGAKLQRMRQFRDLARHTRDHRAATASAVKSEGRRHVQV